MSGGKKAIGFTLLVLLSSLSGCLDSDEKDEQSVIDLVVHYDSTSGTIQQTFIGGSQIDLTGVTLNFDFARTTSEFDLATFSIEPGDGRSPITVNADETANIDVEYELHGLFSVILTATDVEENSENMTLIVRIEKHIEWSEQNSAQPDVMAINTEPDNDGPAPKLLAIQSTVENPSTTGPLGGGGPVTITWELTNADSESKGMKSEQIADGQDAVWEYSLSIPDKEIHELSVNIDQGQDRININHIVDILYDATESATNPFPTESGTEDSQTESE